MKVENLDVNKALAKPSTNTAKEPVTATTTYAKPVDVAESSDLATGLQLMTLKTPVSFKVPAKESAPEISTTKSGGSGWSNFTGGVIGVLNGANDLVDSVDNLTDVELTHNVEVDEKPVNKIVMLLLAGIGVLILVFKRK